MGYQLFSERESKVLELKSTIKKFDGIIKTAVAFANGVGGKIIIGVDDKSKKIIGIDDALRDRMYDDFPNSLYDSTSPGLIPQIYEQRFAEEIVLVIEIPPSLKKPCFLRSKGIPKGIFIRVGSSTRSTSEEYVEELMRENKRVTYDEEIVHTNMNALSEFLLKEYYQKQPSSVALLEDKIIGRSAANAEKHFPTVAGLLLFSETPDQFIPEAHIICTRFAGTQGRNIIQTEEIKGTISKQIEVSFNLVASWIKRNYQLQATRLTSRSLIPEVALREVIANAIIHRKYSIPGATKIALYDDHLEIFSPGNFPGHINIDNLGEGITHFRNPVLGRMAHKMGIIEKLGSGIKLIFDSCKDAKRVPPRFNEDGDYVKVVFEFKDIKDETKSDEEMLLEYFELKQTLTIKEMIDHLDRSKNTVFKVVHKLIDNGEVKKVGKGRNTRYVLK